MAMMQGPNEPDLGIVSSPRLLLRPSRTLDVELSNQAAQAAAMSSDDVVTEADSFELHVVNVNPTGKEHDVQTFVQSFTPS